MKTKKDLIEELNRERESCQKKIDKIYGLEKEGRELKLEKENIKQELETTNQELFKNQKFKNTILKIISGEAKAKSKIEVLKDLFDLNPYTPSTHHVGDFT